MSQPNAEVTALLREWSGGKDGALDQLMPLVYDQLRSMARHSMRSERPDHTLRRTALVHEAYLRIVESGAIVHDSAHFYALAATIMRNVLLDWARSHDRAKRGGGAQKEELFEHSAVTEEDPETVIEIDRLLNRLTEFDPRKAKIVEMIFFGGLTYDETAEVLKISAVTVHRELKMAKAWMLTALRPKNDCSDGGPASTSTA